MACHTYHTPGMMSVKAYERQTTGTWTTFQEIQQRRLELLECGVAVVAGLLLAQRQIKHDVGRGGQGLPLP